MSGDNYLFAVILVMTAATFFTRAIPFIAFKRNKDHPLLIYLGTYMPAAIMTLLVLYSLKNVQLGAPPYGANELIALLLTTVLHLWRGNALLSIFAGTGFYMAALQLAWLT